MKEPLAQRLRPRTLDEVCGQRHLLAPGQVFRRTIDRGVIPNMIFYGPSGVGKTTVASIIAANSGMRLYKLNGTTASTSDIKSVLGDIGTLNAANGILLYLDEIQYFTKKQQQTLLEHIENGNITLIASTTENPYFYVYNAILSRSTVFEFQPVSPEEIQRAVMRAFHFLQEETGVPVCLEDGVAETISRSCGGDVRKAINTVELCCLAAELDAQGGRLVRLEDASQLAQKSGMRYDRDGDEHYDVVSAFQKSMRGSDPDAALHYLARLVEAGDLPSICRRLMVCCCEDVGLAYPQLIPIVKACVDAAQQVGFPEARIPLADAVILVSTAPKSNSGIMGIERAMADLSAGKAGEVPVYLKDAHYQGAKRLGRGLTYQFPHAYPNHWVKQQYLPDGLKDVQYYEYGENKTEQAAKAYWDKIKNKT